MGVARAPFASFAGDDKVEVVTHPEMDPRLAVKRAEWLLECPHQRRYNAIGFNCEHLARWCATGWETESLQVRRLFLTRSIFVGGPLALYVSRLGHPLAALIRHDPGLGAGATRSAAHPRFRKRSERSTRADDVGRRRRSAVARRGDPGGRPPRRSLRSGRPATARTSSRTQPAASRPALLPGAGLETGRRRATEFLEIFPKPPKRVGGTLRKTFKISARASSSKPTGKTGSDPLSVTLSPRRRWATSRSAGQTHRDRPVTHHGERESP
jgi:hypothetical protein